MTSSALWWCSAGPHVGAPSARFASAKFFSPTALAHDGGPLRRSETRQFKQSKEPVVIITACRMRGWRATGVRSTAERDNLRSREPLRRRNTHEEMVDCPFDPEPTATASSGHDADAQAKGRLGWRREFRKIRVTFSPASQNTSYRARRHRKRNHTVLNGLRRRSQMHDCMLTRAVPNRKKKCATCGPFRGPITHGFAETKKGRSCRVWDSVGDRHASEVELTSPKRSYRGGMTCPKRQSPARNRPRALDLGSIW